MWMILELVGAADGRLTVVTQQDERFLLDLPGKPELEEFTLQATLPEAAGHYAALARALQVTDAELIVVTGNPNVLIDAEFAHRVNAATVAAPPADQLAVITGKGVDRWGNAYCALYASLDPQLPFCRSDVAVVDSSSDIFVISRPHLMAILESASGVPMSSFAGLAVLEGYLAGRVSYFSPHLAAGINGRMLTRDVFEHARLVQDAVAVRTVPVKLQSVDGVLDLGEPAPPLAGKRERLLSRRADLDQLIGETILAHCDRMSLTIVTRTQFSRPHLLRRMLTSLSRWRDGHTNLDVVLSTDIDRERAEGELAALQAEFPSLKLGLAWNGDRAERSRVRNLLGGLAVAQGDYVAFVDDDDHVHFQILEALAATRFRGAMPVLFVDTELRNENWVPNGQDRWVLESSSFHHFYPGSAWRSMFRGVNQLPICAAILPREWATQTLGQFDFRHDYSEDFTIWLLLLESPDLPLIVDVPRTFCLVSLREEGANTVTEKDRSRWVRDITLFLHDLHISNPLFGEGRLQTAIAAKPASTEPALPPQDPELARVRRELAIMRIENDQLRRSVADASVARQAAR